MNLQDFRIGWRLLQKDPGYSLVAILGLAVGLAVCLLLFGYARYSWQYNSQVPDAEHVYLIKQRNNTELGAPWIDQAPVLLREVAAHSAGVTAASGYLTWWPLTLKADGVPYKLRSLTALPGFAEMMGLQAIRGDLHEALTRPDSIALTEGTAIRLFGTPDVVGRTTLLSVVDDGSPDNPDSTGVVRIAAILPNPSANTTITYEVLHGPKLVMLPPWMGTEALVGDHGFPGNLLIRVRPDASLAAITGALQHAVDQTPVLQHLPPEMRERLGNRKTFDIKLARLRDAYFDREVASNFLSQRVDRGDATVVRGLIAVGVLMLALAAINYVNLTTIRVMRRQREIAMRKVLGARRGRLARQFIAESLLVATLATALGLLLAWLALPLFGKLMSRDLASVIGLGNVVVALSIGLVLGLLTAIYPMWISFGVRPSRILTGRPDAESAPSRRLRQTLSVLQVAVAMGLASYTLAILWQTRYATESSPGFDPSPLIALEFPDAITGRKSDNAAHFMTALSRQRAIAGVAVTGDWVGRPKERNSTEIARLGGRGITMAIKAVSASFFEQYRIRPVEGRLFDPKIDAEEDSVPIVINAIAARELGFASPQRAVGQLLSFRNGSTEEIRRIVGVAPEIRLDSLRQPPRAIAYQLWMADGILTVRASGSTADAERAVRRLWAEYFPNDMLELTPAKDIYAANYADDARLARLLAIATLIAMIIAAFGAYVLAADAVQRRTGEIALHKLFGARRADIGRLIAMDFGLIVLLAAALALPLTTLAIARYLATYTEHTPLAYGSLALALAAAMTIVAVAGARHAWIAMSLKPAIALRR